MHIFIFVTVLAIIYIAVLCYVLKKSREATEKELDEESLLAKAYKESPPRVNVHVTSRGVMRTPTINADDYRKKRSVASSSSNQSRKRNSSSSTDYSYNSPSWGAEDFSHSSHSPSSSFDGFGGGGSF